MKIMCNSKCHLLKVVRDYDNTITEEDLKHIGNIKDLSYMRVIKMDLLLKK